MEKIYPYAVSKIKVKENKLLTKSMYEQLASENNISKIVSILREKGYDFDMIQRNEDFELVLKKAEEELYKLIKEIIEENDFIEIFLSKNDYYNIKLILKSKIQGKKYESNLIDSGLISKQQIASIMENEDYNRLDNNTKLAIFEAKEQYEKTKMPYFLQSYNYILCFHILRLLLNQIHQLAH